MPDLAPLALRYLLWLICLRVAYAVAVTYLGLPNAVATSVILAAVPAMEIGMQAVQRASRPLAMGEWARIWAVMALVYLVVNVVIPASLVPGFRVAMADPIRLQTLALVSAATAAMLALFLWIGVRTARRGT